MQTSVLAVVILIFVIGTSAFQRINIGLLSLFMAWVLGCLIAGMDVTDVVGGFPVSMFIVLVAVSFLFGIAGHNGTMEKITRLLMRTVQGRRVFLPAIFFLIAAILSTLGAGNLGAVALLAPVAMTVAKKASVGAFFMTVMLIYGANAGTFSPFAFTGIIANGLVRKIGLSMDPWRDIYVPSLLVQTTLAAANYLIFLYVCRKKIFLRHAVDTAEPDVSRPFTPPQIMTAGAILALILGVSVFRFDPGFLALGLSVLLVAAGASNGEEDMKSVPWNIVLMVCGVSTLVSTVERAGGLELLLSWLSTISTAANAPGMLALVVGVISSFSSSSAVVMPTFIPLVPGLVEKWGTVDPVALVSAINIGAHVVDISPLSTLGALCLANAVKGEDRRLLFRILLAYGLAMSVIGALVSQIFFGGR